MTASEKLITDNLDIWASVIRHKSNAGRGRSKKTELYGIQKLRALILDLAVSGLLVSQDPNDESAEKLLAKITTEKERLAKEGKIKKARNSKVAAVTPEKTLPLGWSHCTLSDISEIVRGITFPASEKSRTLEEGRVACLRTSNVQEHIEWDDILYIREEFVKREDQYILQNDIVMSMANSRELVGKVAAISSMPESKTTFGGFLGVIRPIIADSGFITCLLRSPKIRQELIESASQTTNIANISLAKLKPLILALPPLKEQHRIVAKVDELMALCDQLEQQTEASIAAHQTLVETLLGALTNAPDHASFQQAWQRIAEHFDTLFTTEHSIDQLKQTILQLAVMGKLVPQNSREEPATILLERIAAEKKALGIKASNSPMELNGEDPIFDPPNGWQWCLLGDLALHSEAGWSPKCEEIPREGNNWGVLKVSAVTWGNFNPYENKQLPQNLAPRPEYEVKSGDFLISRANTAELVARSVVVGHTHQDNLMISDKIIRFSFSTNVLPDYINLVNNSPRSRSYYLRVAGGTSSSMKNVSRRQIQNLPIPLPPLLEQKRIVQKVEALIDFCDRLNNNICNLKSQQARIAMAIASEAKKKWN